METRAIENPPETFAGSFREGGVPLLSIVAIALVARLIAINSELWTDEILALQSSFRLSLAEIVTTYSGDTHHPLYAAFARASLVMFGESPWALRLPALLFGTASVAMTYVVARLVASRLQALLASLLLAVSYHHVWFSQNARGYTLIGLLALVSTWALVRMLDRPSWRLAVLFAASSALGAYTHLTMVFVAIGQAVVAAVALVRPTGARIAWRIPVSAFGLAALFTLVLYAPMIDQVVNFFVNVPSRLLGTSTPSWAFGEAIRVLLVGTGTSNVIAAGLVLVLGTVVALTGFVSILRANRNLALAFALPPLAVLLGALLGRGTMYPRFFFFVAGSAVIVVVRGIFACSEFLQRAFPRLPQRAAALALTMALLLGSTWSLGTNYRYPKQDFAGAMRFVLASHAPGDVVAFAGVPGEPYRTIHGRDWPTVKSVAQLDSLRRQGAVRTWLIYTFPRYLQVGAPDLAALVSRDCTDPTVFQGTVGGGDVMVCRLEPGAKDPA